jgi:hypothetical protein
VKVKATGGTQEQPLEVPKEFLVKVQPFYGCPDLNLRAELRLRIPPTDGAGDKRLAIGFRFYRLADELEILAGAISNQVKEQTDCPVWR